MLLEQVETLLKTQEPITASEIPSTNFAGRQNVLNGGGVGVVRPTPTAEFNNTDPSLGLNGVGTEPWGFNGESPQAPMDNMNFPADLNMGMSLDDSTFSWEMIGLGLEEPLPHQDTIDELYASLPAESRSKCSYKPLQTSNLLRQNPPFFAHGPQISISCCHESVSPLKFCTLFYVFPYW